MSSLLEEMITSVNPHHRDHVLITSGESQFHVSDESIYLLNLLMDSFRRIEVKQFGEATINNGAIYVTLKVMVEDNKFHCIGHDGLALTYGTTIILHRNLWDLIYTEGAGLLCGRCIEARCWGIEGSVSQWHRFSDRTYIVIRNDLITKG